MEDNFILANRNRKEFTCPCCLGDIVPPWGLIILWLRMRAEDAQKQGPDWLQIGAFGAGRWNGDTVEAIDASHESYRSALVHYRNVSQEAITDWMEYKGISIPNSDQPC